MSTSSVSGRVVIGMDPHKRSATIEVMTADESVLGGGRFATAPDGYAAMRRYAGQWPDRVWAIEGCAGIGKHIAVRLLAERLGRADGEGGGCRHGPGSSRLGKVERPMRPMRTRSRWSGPG